MSRGVMGVVRGCGVAVCALVGLGTPAAAQMTPSTFTYQGRLDRDGAPYTGPASIRVSVFGSIFDPDLRLPARESSADVVNGLFSIDLDFGTAGLLLPNAFYEVAVKTPDMAGYQVLPRIPVRSAPLAGAAYRAMMLDSVVTSADPYNTRVAAQFDGSDYAIANAHWQGFNSGPGGLLTQIVLDTRLTSAVSGATLRIYAGQGVSGTLLHAQRVYVASQGEAILNVAPGLAMGANQFYTWELTAPDGALIGLGCSTGDGDPSTISSRPGTDFFYQAFAGEQENMVFRASRVGVNEPNPLAPLHVSSVDTSVARFSSKNIQGAAITLESRATPFVYEFKVHDIGNPTGDLGGQLSIERIGGSASLWLHAKGLGVNTRREDAALTVASSTSLAGLMVSQAEQGAVFALENSSIAGDRWEINSTGVGNVLGGGWLTLGNPTSRVLVSPFGQVGVGTVPATMLHVDGGGDASLSGGGFFQAGPTSGQNLLVDNNEIMARANGAASPLFLNAEGGGVAIGGLTVPAAKLHVFNGGNLSQGEAAFIQAGLTTGTNLSLDSNEIQVLNNGVGASLFLNFRGGQVFVGDTANPIVGNAMQVNGNALKPGGGAWGVLSDRRAKTDIEPMRGTLDRLLALRGYSYRYTDDAIRQGGALRGTQIGLMAQDVQRVFPDWVYADEQGRLNVTERATTALMVESLRDLRAEKDAADEMLRAELEAARVRVQSLEEENAAMRARLERLERAIGAR